MSIVSVYIECKQSTMSPYSSNFMLLNKIYICKRWYNPLYCVCCGSLSYLTSCISKAEKISHSPTKIWLCYTDKIG